METFGEARLRRGALALLFLAGLALSAVMVARSQVGGDQLNLLARGWLLAEHGELVTYGNPTSTGGVEPGAATSLLVGLPLLAWSDHRAPVVLVLLCHLVGYLLLDRVLHEALGFRGRWLLCVLYWLNPWRLYHSAFLWNPNYLFLVGAVHAWSAFRMRRGPRGVPSLCHGLALAMAVQLHPSALILALVSLGLWLRGRLRPHWPGLAAGGLAGSLTLVPWLLELGGGSGLDWVGEGDGFPGRGLVLVFPLVKGLLYWLRYSSLFLPERALSLDFVELDGVGASTLETVLALAFGAVGVVGVGLAAVANLRLWRRPWRRGDPGLEPLRRRWSRLRAPWEVGSGSGRAWLRAYAGWTLAAALVVFALSPTTPQPWQALIVLHAAVIPVVLLAEAWLRSPRHRGKARTALRFHAAASLVLALATAFASPHYRCGGRDGLRLALRHDSPMLHELGIQETCRLPVARADGWWPDVLPAPGSEAVGARIGREASPPAKESPARRIPPG